MTENLFTIKDLSVTFRNGAHPIKAVDRVSFNIPKGTTVGVVGESGSGKTTIGRAIAGIGPITSGEIRYQNQLLTKFSRVQRHAFRSQIQMVFQDPFAALNPRQKVGAIIGEGLENFHLEPTAARRQQRIITLLEEVGLPADAINRFPHEFSGGQRQRIGIARALAVQPQFLVLDEPISALDVSIQAQIVNLLHKIQQEQHLTYLFIAHDLSMVHHISDQIIVMYRGHIMEAGPTQAVYHHPLHSYTQALLSAVPHADPLYEHQKKVTTFNDQTVTGHLVEREPKHFVLTNN